MRKAFASGLLAITVLAGAAMMLGACNTVAGFGQDVSAAGTAVNNSAEKVKNGL
jgi:predicted small secreted protein